MPFPKGHVPWNKRPDPPKEGWPDGLPRVFCGKCRKWKFLWEMASEASQPPLTLRCKSCENARLRLRSRKRERKPCPTLGCQGLTWGYRKVCPKCYARNYPRRGTKRPEDWRRAQRLVDWALGYAHRPIPPHIKYRSREYYVYCNRRLNLKRWTLQRIARGEFRGLGLEHV